MKSRLQLILFYAIFWLTFFEFSRILFLVYNHALTAGLDWSTIFHTFISGFAHDASMVGYMVELVSILLCISIFTKENGKIRIALNVLTIVLLTAGTIITVSDAELYRNWGYRMDASVLEYLATPKEAIASTPVWHIALLVLLAITIFVGFYWIYKKWVATLCNKFEKTKSLNLVILILLMGAMIIPIRGGLSVATLRTGAVYFSKKPFANHAAINDQWHFLSSAFSSKKEEPNIFMEESECNNICDKLLHSKQQKPTQLIANKRPNIILFILESFTASHCGVLGGQEGVTPNLDSIAKSGVLFSNCYGNGTKSEMGIISILSGYPALPTASIMKYNEKTEKLPYLTHIFDSLGYALALYHGGDIRFGNMNSYFSYGGVENCVTIDDFGIEAKATKWGALDHVVLSRMLTDLHSKKEPFFTICYTLSSHEPFNVPMKSKFYGQNDYSKLLNSVHYSDSCIGDFMRRARLEPWWNNTLVIFISDHGSRITQNAQIVSSQDKFHIPFIWSGGAITTDTVISELVSQCDFPMMLCNQLDLPSSQFSFSKDILRGDEPFASYAFNNGFGYLRGNQSFSWDNENAAIVKKTNNLHDTTLQQGKALLQKVTTDFCRK